MNFNEAEEVLAHKSPIEVRIFRYWFRMFCLHTYVKHLITSDSLIGPIIVSECVMCGKRKYKSMDGT